MQTAYHSVVSNKMTKICLDFQNMTTCFLFFLLVEIAADVSRGEFDVPEEEFSKTLVRKGKDNLSPYTSYQNRTIRTKVQLPLNYFRNSINIDVEGFRIERFENKTWLERD